MVPGIGGQMSSLIQAGNVGNGVKTVIARIAVATPRGCTGAAPDPTLYFVRLGVASVRL